MPIEKNDRLLSLVLLLLSMAWYRPCAAGGDKHVIYLTSGIILPCKGYFYRGENYKVRFNHHEPLIIPEDMVFATGAIHRHLPEEYRLDCKYDSVSKTYIKLPCYYIRDPGFFFKWQVSVGAIDGMRLMAGYRINTYVAVGLGIGAEYGLTLAYSSNYLYNPNPNFAPAYVYNSGYTPLFLYVTGDVLRTRITPFYSFEMGYNLPWFKHLQTDSQDGAVTGPYSYYTNYGGLMAGAGFGCRFYSRHKHSDISISVNFNAGYVSIKTDGFQGFTTTQPYMLIYATTTSRYTMTQPSFRFSVGF